MKRTILFRGKVLFDGSWAYGSLRIRSGVRHGIIETLHGQGWDVDKKTIGQWSGLRDVNAKKIFEGDIFVTRVSPKRIVVRWQFDKGIRIGFNISAGRNFHRKEVIGNIHDNPELLKVKGNKYANTKKT